MAKLSPLQQTKADHGSKEALADKVIGFLSAREDEDQADFENRIRTLSNTKLLRLFSANQTLSSKYGSKDDLVKKISEARFKGQNADYIAKISTFSAPKLLDLARQHKL